MLHSLCNRELGTGVINACANIAARPFRVAGITITDATFGTIEAAGLLVVLWRVLEQCADAAEQRARVISGIDTIPAALATLEVKLPSKHWQRANTPILLEVATKYPALTRSLQVLKIAFNEYDERADLGAFAACATRLRELVFWHCGITSVRALAGRCELLTKVVFVGCENLTNLKGLGHHEHLEVVDARNSGITSIEPLRTCPALTKADLSGCRLFPSSDADFSPRVVVLRGSFTHTTQPHNCCCS